MLYRLFTLLLGPILLLQASYVRRATPRLPEPEGLRFGVTGSGPKTSVLIAGDSSAVGVGVDKQENALTGRLVTELSVDHEVSWKLIAKTGDTSGKVLKRLNESSKSSFNYVLLSIGVNDVTSKVSPKASVNNLQLIINLLKTEFNAQHILISRVPPMHLFPALPQPLRWWLGKKASKLNDALKSAIHSDEQCSFLDIELPLENEYMAKDGFHPGAPAYKVWANYAAKIIQLDLRARENY